MKRSSIITAIIFAAGSLCANAQLVMDTSEPERVFNIGARIGVNTSNLSNNMQSVVSGIHSSANEWNAGFTCGAIVDIKIRNYLAIQPGFFFETQSNGFQRVHVIENDDTHVSIVDGDHTSAYFKIPILASFRLLLRHNLEWQIEAGPYFSFGLWGNEKYTSLVSGQPATEQRYKRSYFGDNGIVESYDWGFKMGMGLLFQERWYVGIHYEAGCRNVLKSNAYSDNLIYSNLSGHNKTWDFTIGYNF